MSIFRTKSIDALIAASEDPEKKLRRTFGPWSLTALGIGAVIGSGIFILTGTAAAGETLSYKSILHAPVLDLLMHGTKALSMTGRPGAGPAISLSFLLTAIACSFAALCYAELASMIPIAGSAYTYAYATLGETCRLDHRLGPDPGVRRLQHGGGGGLLRLFQRRAGQRLRLASAGQARQSADCRRRSSPANWFNVSALLVLLILTWILVRGVRESASTNNVMVLIKIAAILIFVIGAARAVNTANWHPFAPNGFPGVLTGAAIVFFTYIGFDSVSTAAEECRRPQRDLPFGIIMTLVICAMLYISVALVLTGIAHYDTLNNAAPVANALKALGYNGIRQWVSIGAIVGMLSLAAGVSVRAGAHLVRHVARRPAAQDVFQGAPGSQDAAHQHLDRGPGGGNSGGHLGYRDVRRSGEHRDAVRVHHRLAGRDRAAQDAARPSARIPRAGVAVAADDLHRLLPGADDGLPLETWVRFFVWLLIGFAIYFPFGRKHSALAAR